MKEKKKKLTLQEQLAARKYKKPGNLVMTGYHLLDKYIVGRKYRPHYVIKDDINKCEGPCFLIWNHLSRLDHLFVKEITHPRKITIVAGYNEFFRKKFSTIFNWMNIIPKKNYTDDFPSIRAMHSIIKQNGCICFSPEGMSSIYGTNQPIVAGTGRFLQSFHIPVYFMQLRGSYLTSTKVCLDERPGRVEAELSLLFTPEQMDAMTPAEIDEKINQAFKSDDYEWGKQNGIQWKNTKTICKRLEDICYKCPKCGEEFSMLGQNDEIKCLKCGNGAKMNASYEFLPFDENCVLPISPSKWVENERIDIIKEIRENKTFSFSDKVKIGELPKDHYIKGKDATSEPCGEGVLTFDHKGIHFEGTKNGQPWSFDKSYKSQFSLVIVTDTSYFALYINGEYYDFFPEGKTVGKMLLICEEMHRLHFNIWKNFSWCDYMYETYLESDKALREEEANQNK